jgi:hypothetical protein
LCTRLKILRLPGCHSQAQVLFPINGDRLWSGITHSMVISIIYLPATPHPREPGSHGRTPA